MAEAAEITTTPPPPTQGRPGDLPPWSEVWQIPILLVGLTLFVVGLYLAIPAQKKDDFPGALNSAVQCMQANNFTDAQAKLTEISQRIEFAPKDQQAKYNQLWGDLIYFQIETNTGGGFDTAENRSKIDKWYTESKDLGQKFDGLHLQRWADTLVALDRREEALKIVDQLKDEAPERRYLILRRLIERRLKNLQTVNNDEIAELMARFMQEVGLETVASKRRAQELWSAEWQARMALAANPQGAIDLLLRRLVYFKDQGGDKDLPPLMVILAKAYQRAGELGEARRWFRAAQQRLLPSEKLMAEVLVGLGQIEMADAGSSRSTDGSDLRTALDNFARAETEYPTSPAYIDAVVGRADCEARIGVHSEAMEHFGRAIKRVLEENPRNPILVQHIIDTVRGHFSTQSDQGEFRQALEYLSLLIPLYAGQQDLPQDVLLQFATTHERIGKAQQQVAIASANKQASETSEIAAAASTQPAAADPQRKLALQEAAIQFSKAADFYLRHARAVALTDDAAFGGSLWKASSCYLEARLWKKAIEVYAEFVRTRPGDPRQLQALAQLGLAYQADDQPGAAVGFYEQLVTEHPNTPEAYDTLVPLARCYVALNQYDKAKRVLLYVITDHPAITPQSNTYRQALVEIGKLHYQLKEFEPAIEALHKAVLREKNSPQLPSLKFLLADSYRQSVIELVKSMDETLPQTKRLALQSERARRLEQALLLFGQVVSDLEIQEQSTLSPLEKLYLRNAYFYRGDAAYDLGRFEQSISLYDQAANRWRGHPASMVALVQIVNAYCQLGQIQEAKVANDRAREQLKRIPDDAFNDPSLPMTRQHWQDWLKWTSDMNLFAANPGKPAQKPR